MRIVYSNSVVGLFFNRINRLNLTATVRHYFLTIKGLEEASPHRNQTEIEEEQEEIRAAESEKRRRAVAKLTATTAVAEVSDQNMRRVKILMLGDSGVGKTSLIMRWTADTFSANMVGTVGVNFKTKRVCIAEEYVQVQVWDTAGQEHFHKITTSYYRGANAILLVYDLSDPRTVANVQYWLTNIKAHASESVHVALIGNKSDLKASGVEAAKTSSSSSSSSTATTDEPLDGQHWADRIGVRHFETSAKDSTNVDDAFMTVVSSYLNSLKPDRSNGGAASSSGDRHGGSGGGGDPSKAKKEKKGKSKLKLGLPKGLGGKKSKKAAASADGTATASNTESSDEHDNHGHRKDKEKCCIS
jgi:small GTP-binding protein